MKIKFKKIIFYLSLFIFIGFLLVSCGNQSDETDENNIYIESFKYEIVENESSVANELSYTLSFSMGFSVPENATKRGFRIEIDGKRAMRFAIDYCNTEDIILSSSTDTYPYALLNYSIPNDENFILATVKLKITTADLIDDINNFVGIDCVATYFDCNMIDSHNLKGNDRYFNMNYSSNTGIYYEYNEFSEAYKVISVVTESKSIKIPSIYNNHPVKIIDEEAFEAATNLEELILPDTLTSIPEGLLSGLTKLKSLSIPFVGASLNGSSNNHFGYIFGAYSYSSNLTDVPSSLKEVTILGGTSIGADAFRGCKSLESITISSSVLEIGQRAFFECSSLSNITIEKGLTSIGASAFYKCSSLTDIILPDSVISIGEEAFEDCSALLSVEISKNIANIGAFAFNHCSNLKNTHYNGSIADWCNIHFGNAYSNPTYYTNQFCIRNSNNEWEEVRSIVIPNDVTSIGDYAFYNCTSLERVTIGSGVTCIGDYAFNNCNNLESITIGQNVSNIVDSNAFWNCIRLVEIYNYSNENIGIASSEYDSIGTNAKVIHTQSESSCLIEKDDYLFIKDEKDKYYLVKYKGAKKDLELPKDIEGCNYEINSYAFYDCSNLTSITIPEGVTSIGLGALSWCSNLTSVVIPQSVTSIGELAFYNCNSLTSITIPNGITSIEQYTFSECSNLTSIIIPDSITSIGDYAFSNCSSITSIVLPDNVASIGRYAFSDCRSLTNITIPKGVTRIESDTFARCSSLENITIGINVTSIGEYAFYDCSNLISIVIATSVTNIEESICAKCDCLKEVYYMGTANQWGTIVISKNFDLFSATIYYYSETNPTEEGNYWHYVDGVVTKW